MTANLNFQDHKIIWLKSASKQLDKLPHIEQKKILKKLDELLLKPEKLDIKKLRGFDDFYRIRSGNYRTIFKLFKRKNQIIIAAVGHRKEVYDLLKNLAQMLRLFEFSAQA